MSEPTQPVAVAPVLTAETPKREQVPGQGEIVNGGKVDLRKTHPALWRVVMVFAVLNIGLGLNFVFLSPTFPIFDQSYYLWGGIFLVLGLAKIVFLNHCRRLRLVRATMALEVAYMLFLALGTTEPFIQGSGSLQLPIVYLGLAALELPLLLEPFINPWTARRD